MSKDQAGEFRLACWPLEMNTNKQSKAWELMGTAVKNTCSASMGSQPSVPLDDDHPCWQIQVSGASALSKGGQRSRFLLMKSLHFKCWQHVQYHVRQEVLATGHWFPKLCRISASPVEPMPKSCPIPLKMSGARS